MGFCEFLGPVIWPFFRFTRCFLPPFSLRLRCDFFYSVFPACLSLVCCLLTFRVVVGPVVYRTFAGVDHGFFRFFEYVSRYGPFSGK